MRIGLSTAAYYGRLETEEAAARIGALGIPWCEVFLETFSEYTPAFARLTRQSLGDTGVLSVHNKTQHFEGDIFGRSPRQRDDAFRLMESFLDAGAVLGAGVYVYHGPASIRNPSPPLARWAEPLGRAIELSAARGIDLAWEVVSWCFLNAPDRVRAFRQVWPELHFVLDIKQALELGHNPLDYIEAMGDRLRHVHVLDHDADGRYVLPGRGVYDFRTLARALGDNGYTGDVILEPYESTFETDAELLASIDWLRDVFDAR